MRRHARALMELTLIAGLAVLLTLSAVVGPAQAGVEAAAPQQAATTQSVDISNFAFNPGTIKIAVGTKVTWTNSDSAPHTVTGDNGEFDSGRLQPGSTFDYTFDTVGTFAYHCAIHSSMHGTVEVVEAGSADLTQPTAKAPIAMAPARKPAAKNNAYGSGQQGYGTYGGYGMNGYRMPYYSCCYKPLYTPYRFVRPYYFPYRPVYRPYFRPYFRPCYGRCW